MLHGDRRYASQKETSKPNVNLVSEPDLFAFFEKTWDEGPLAVSDPNNLRSGSKMCTVHRFS